MFAKRLFVCLSLLLAQKFAGLVSSTYTYSTVVYSTVVYSTVVLHSGIYITQWYTYYTVVYSTVVVYILHSDLLYMVD